MTFSSNDSLRYLMLQVFSTDFAVNTATSPFEQKCEFLVSYNSSVLDTPFEDGSTHLLRRTR